MLCGDDVEAAEDDQEDDQHEGHDDEGDEGDLGQEGHGAHLPRVHHGARRRGLLHNIYSARAQDGPQEVERN